MLVLNTNEQIGRRLSNDIVWGYPDFNAILMKPICPSDPITSISNYKQANPQQSILITPETYPIKAYSVNGTAVNMICNILDRDRLFDGSGGAQVDAIDFFWNQWYSVQWADVSYLSERYFLSISRSIKLRIGMLESLEAGAIVGKNIKANLNFSNTATLSNQLKSFVTQYSHDLKIEFEFGLLRRNWSIQKIGTIPIVDEKNKTFPMDRNLNERSWSWNFFVEGNFEGVTAQEWDKVVIDVKCDFSVSSTPKPWTSSSAQIKYIVGIWFWNNSSPLQNIPSNWDHKSQVNPRPIQISIE